MGKIIQFPQTIVVQRNLRLATRRMDRANKIIEAGPGDTPQSQATYAGTLACYELDVASLRRAEAEINTADADDAFHYKGMVYRAHASIAGAN